MDYSKKSDKEYEYKRRVLTHILDCSEFQLDRIALDALVKSLSDKPSGHIKRAYGNKVV